LPSHWQSAAARLPPPNRLSTCSSFWPSILKRTQTEARQNLVRGFWNFDEDWERAVNGRPPVGTEQFKVGGTHCGYAGQGRVSEQADGTQYEPLTSDDREIRELLSRFLRNGIG
jgi:hypothetical protein